MKKQTFLISISFLIVLLAAVVAITGLYAPTLYGHQFLPDPVWKANDLVTLFGAVPALTLGVYFARKGSARAIYLWAGITAFLVYSFCFRLFGSPLNIFFIFYSLIIVLSAITLGMLISILNRYRIPAVFKKELPSRYLNILLISISLVLFFTETDFLISSILSNRDLSTGTSPEINTGFALDFILLIPASLVAVYLLIMKKRSGYLMGVIVFVICFFYGAVYSLRAGIEVNFDPSVPDRTNLLSAFYVFVCLAGIVGSFFFLKNMRNESYFPPVEKCGFDVTENSNKIAAV